MSMSSVPCRRSDLSLAATGSLLDCPGKIMSRSFLDCQGGPEGSVASERSALFPESGEHGAETVGHQPVRAVLQVIKRSPLGDETSIDPVFMTDEGLLSVERSIDEGRIVDHDYLVTRLSFTDEDVLDHAEP